jgi:hypothetical protein
MEHLMKFLSKKLVLIVLLSTLPLQAHAGWMPQWLSTVSQSLQPITNFIKDHKGAFIVGAGALLCTGFVGGYFYYKNYKKTLNTSEEPTEEKEKLQQNTENKPLKTEDGEEVTQKDPQQEERKEEIEKDKEKNVSENGFILVSASEQSQPEEIVTPTITTNHLVDSKEDKKEKETEVLPEKESHPEASPVMTAENNDKIQWRKGKEKLPTVNEQYLKKGENENNEREKEKEQENLSHEKTTQWLYQTFIDWDKVCKHLRDYKLPKVVGHDKRNKELAIPLKELEIALDHYFDLLKDDFEIFQNPQHWVNEEVAQNLMKSIQSEKNKAVFDPFVQKLVVNPGSTIAFHGDIHGDIKSLNAFIQDLATKGYLDEENPFKIARDKKDFYIIFLGDFTDRGWYGPEVIYTVLRLKHANPNRVFMVRGNHEDATMNKKEAKNGANGFFAQLRGKYRIKKTNSIFEKINKLYETLPLALYLGTQGANKTNYLLCCHGGVEVGFDPRTLLNHKEKIAFTKLNTLDREGALSQLVNDNNLFQLFKGVKRSLTPIGLAENIIQNLETAYLEPYLPQGIITPLQSDGKKFISTIGFQWNDYEVRVETELLRNYYFVKDNPGRGWIIGKTFNQAALTLQSDAHNKIRGVMRAHQHTANPENLTPMMKRIFNTDHLDHDENIGVGKLWIQPGEKPGHSLWDNIVCTFNVSPHTPYQVLGYRYDTYGLLTTAEKFSDWKLEVCRIEVLKKQRKTKT